VAAKGARARDAGSGTGRWLQIYYSQEDYRVFRTIWEGCEFFRGKRAALTGE